ncbi:protein LIFEGUARD 2-like [Carex rostrata]
MHFRQPNAGEFRSEVEGFHTITIENEEKEDAGDRVEDFDPVIIENVEVRWAFLKKVYSVLAIEMLIMVAVAWTIVFVPPVANFFVSTSIGFGLYIFSLILPFIVLYALYFYHRYHPFNLLLLGVFTVAMSFAVGLTCAFINGEIILESVILTSAVVVSLTMYTFWAAKNCHNFFQIDYYEAAIMIFMVFVLIQIYFPLGSASLMVYGGLASLVFCSYIIYDTNNNLMERYSYKEYVWATIALNFVDIFHLLFSLANY